MRARRLLVALTAVATVQVFGLTPPSKSDGPVRLLNCVVSGSGMLEAEVDSQTDDPMTCDIQCNYDIGGQIFTHWFQETIPARFNGKIGRFDTTSGKKGSYSGEIGNCRKSPR